MAGLFLAGLPGPRPQLPRCTTPVERETDGSRSLAVACSGSGQMPRGPARQLFGLALDPNRADSLTLETLPGIGPARAAAILRAREERPFESVEALRRVAGIGPVTLRRIAPHLAVEQPHLQRNR